MTAFHCSARRSRGAARTLANFAFTVCLAASAVAHGTTEEAAEAAARTAAMAEDVARQLDDIDAQYRALRRRLEAIDANRAALETLLDRVAAPDTVRAGSGHTDAAPPPTVGEEQRQVLEAREQEELPELPRISEELGGVLTPKGRLILEPSLAFTNNSVNRVSIEALTIVSAVAIGNIDVRAVERETFIAALTGRWGITNRLEAELKASWVSRNDDTVTRSVVDQTDSDAVFNADGNGFGDMEFGLRYQFPRKPGRPFLVGNLRIKSDTGDDPFEFQTRDLINTGRPNFAGTLATGSGFWSVNPSLTFIYPSDPVVVFGNLGYLWTLEDDKGIFRIDRNPGDAEPPERVGFGEVDPGDAWRLSFGMGIGLNEMSSISFSYALDLFSETTIETQRPKKVAGSDVTVGKFLVGYSLKLPGGQPLNLAIGIGTTDAAPDTDITLRVPFTAID